jgi:hypothetical protein
VCKSNPTCLCHTQTPQNLEANENVSEKVCPECKTRQDRSSFSKNRSRYDGLQSVCKTCEKARNKVYYKSTPEKNSARKMYTTLRRELVRTITQPLIEKGCVDCKHYIPNAMDFDHVTGTKLINISSLATMKITDEVMLDMLRQELSKCEVRCANCHRKATMARYKSSKRLRFMANPDDVSEKHRYVYQILQNSACVDCKETDIRVLELDHVKDSKLIPVSQMLNKAQWSVQDLKIEIDKCEVRCVNCHRQKTHDRLAGVEVSVQEKKYVISEDDVTCSCGNKKTYGTLSCPSCQRKPKIEWPDVDAILDKLANQSYLSLGKELGVSDNAIRKYLVRNGVILGSVKTFKK